MEANACGYPKGLYVITTTGSSSMWFQNGLAKTYACEGQKSYEFNLILAYQVTEDGPIVISHQDESMYKCDYWVRRLLSFGKFKLKPTIQQVKAGDWVCLITTLGPQHKAFIFVKDNETFQRQYRINNA
jgi:hypothetical protein